MIFSDSRYKSARIVQIQTPDGNTKSYVFGRIPLKASDLGEEFREVTATDADMLDSLAFDAVERDDLWWVIADVNKILFPLDDLAGQRLIIPTPAIFNQI